MILLGLLSACLLLAPRPGDTGDGPPCGSSADCADDFACLDGRCAFGMCTREADCNKSSTCVAGACEPVCQDRDCPGGFVCDEDTNECLTQCQDFLDCRTAYECCKGFDFDHGYCPTRNACYRL